jgi:hypothetical protein
LATAPTSIVLSAFRWVLRGRVRLRACIFGFVVLAACSHGKTADPGKLGDACSASAPCATGLVCTDAPVGRPATPGHTACAAPGRHYTFRAIAGVSMGAAGSSRLVAEHPEKFDAAGFMGGPLDAALLLRTIEQTFLGGFCPPDKLLAAAALDAADGDNRLDRPDGVPGCTPQTPAPLTHYSRSQRFNHWAFTTNGGTFDRGAHLDIFRDLTLALGNPLSSNPYSPSLAAPLTPAQFEAATCAAPAVVPHVYDPLYSPHGERSAITFCDGDAPVMLCADGKLVDWCAAASLSGHKLADISDAAGFCAQHGGGAHEADRNSSNAAEVDAYFAHQGEVPGCFAGTTKVPFVLAIDLNGNGRRDYHEPLLVQSHEPFSDVGKDGCDDAHEDGKGGCTDPALSPFARGIADPNGDNYDPVRNPAGTEGDFLWEPGEPFQDVGLDGVAGTHDEGEGDGVFTVTPGLKRWLQNDLAVHMTPQINLYSEGGIRDIFDLGAMAERVGASAEAASPGSLTRFADFKSIPPERGVWGATFDPTACNIGALGRNVLLEYGNPAASPQEIRAGDGDHVGTVEQVVDRFIVFFRWLSRRWEPMLPPPGRGSSGVTQVLHFSSAALGADQDFAVSVPAGYDAPANAQRRYPVLYLLHGYGQTAEQMAGTSLSVDIALNLGLIHEMIVVYPSGRCCLAGPHGERTCDESNGTPAGFVRECARGSFYLDRAGYSGADQTKYGQALFELMGEVDKRFRTLSPADGPAF